MTEIYGSGRGRNDPRRAKAWGVIGVGDGADWGTNLTDCRRVAVVACYDRSGELAETLRPMSESVPRATETRSMYTPRSIASPVVRVPR